MHFLEKSKFDKSIFVNCEDDMKSICNYLDMYFGIKYFSYIKYFNDGTHICLATHNNWTDYFYNNLYNYGVVKKPPNKNFSNVTLWSTIEDQAMFKIFREHSGIDYGIILTQQNHASCEFFIFGAYENNPRIIDFYLNNLDILWRHTFFFKDQACNLIKRAEKQRLVLPKYFSTEQPSNVLINADNIQRAMIDSSINKYYVNIMGKEFSLTSSEAKCCFFLIKGKSIKEIATVMNVSPRTIETRLNTIKQKLNCATTSELIKKLIKYTTLKDILF